MSFAFKIGVTNFLKARRYLQAATMSTVYNFETVSVTPTKPYVYHVQLNRPEQLNAMNHTLWMDLGKCFKQLHSDPECRVIVLSGAGKLFTAGLDFKSALANSQAVGEAEDVARKGKILFNLIHQYQDSISQLELCTKPVLAAVHSACIGGGVSIITAADVRYCTKDAWFQIKEIELGLAADVGTLHRLPKIIGSESVSRELCFTARKFDATEALRLGLVSKVFENKDSMMKEVFETAEEISKKSPVAVQGTKRHLIFARDHTVQEGLDHIAIWNQLMLQSEDFINAVVALSTKQKNVEFCKL